MKLIRAKDLHAAADLVAATESPEESGIHGGDLEEFLEESTFTIARGAEPFQPDEVSLVYGIALGVVAVRKADR